MSFTGKLQHNYTFTLDDNVPNISCHTHKSVTHILCLPSSIPKIFHDVAYKAKDRNDLVAGIDEFLDQVTVLPPGEWDPSIRIEPPKNVPSQVHSLFIYNNKNKDFIFSACDQK